MAAAQIEAIIEDLHASTPATDSGVSQSQSSDSTMIDSASPPHGARSKLKAYSCSLHMHHAWQTATVTRHHAGPGATMMMMYGTAAQDRSMAVSVSMHMYV